MIRRAAQVAALAFAVLGTEIAAQEQTETATGAVLRGLDKFSGQVVDIQMQAGRTVQFERLSITLTECRYPAGNPSGNAYAGVQITEAGRDGVVFSGWMIASAPALNAMEHPRYDVWVIRCTTS
ncbi:hypothetical protein GCM10007385_24650 [Tateyamaria omphalii]|uniref:DUF2155 domain-containing protein n=1 Tax=Tateyamaria omphalii TaxID=299262 RepID=UPI001679D7F5|nr:DUF2155 domain-containing protein [Tateyamaria omphalii]GGX55220.1 hypothetical protein GCM10007385_24650 [Tateyamaria omphalii]